MYKKHIKKEDEKKSDSEGMNTDSDEAPKMPSVLKWDGDKYAPSMSTYSTDVFGAATEEAQKYLAVLKKWHTMSVNANLNDSKDIISQIFDVISGKEKGVQVMVVHNGKFLRGISLYEANGTTEGYPEIDEEDHYWYVMFSAAHPATQLPRRLRGKNNDGGVGAALNAAYDGLMSGTLMPVYRHAANPTSYLSLLRAGYRDVNAVKDGFVIPTL